MDTREAIANRIRQLCKERGITPNAISNISAVPQATVKSILNGESKNPGAVTLKKLCDGFEITLGEFFSTPEFDELEQKYNNQTPAISGGRLCVFISKLGKIKLAINIALDLHM